MTRFIVALVTLTAAGLFYVYQEVEAVKIGYFIRKQEEQKSLFVDRQRALKYNIARLKAPQNLERRLEAQKIQLGPPRSWHTLVMAQAGRTQKRAVEPVRAAFPFLGRLLIGTAQAEAKEAN